MSKRPTTREPVSSRLRLPVGRLRDLPIWSKLGLIMIVPIIATIVVGTNGLVNNIGQANDADRARTLSGLSAQASALVHELQSERANAALLLGVIGSPADVEARATFQRQIQKTEDATPRTTGSPGPAWPTRPRTSAGSSRGSTPSCSTCRGCASRSPRAARRSSPAPSSAATAR